MGWFNTIVDISFVFPQGGPDVAGAAAEDVSALA
jgi:hypothetical protein